MLKFKIFSQTKNYILQHFNKPLIYHVNITINYIRRNLDGFKKQYDAVGKQAEP